MLKRFRHSFRDIVRFFFLLVLLVLAVFLGFYTLEAYSLTRYLIKLDGESKWSSDWGGSNPKFFPFPARPTGVFVPALTEMHPMDKWIYTNLIQNGVLIILNILLWILTAIYFYKAVWCSIFRLV